MAHPKHLAVTLSLFMFWYTSAMLAFSTLAWRVSKLVSLCYHGNIMYYQNGPLFTSTIIKLVTKEVTKILAFSVSGVCSLLLFLKYTECFVSYTERGPGKKNKQQNTTTSNKK